MATCRQKSVSIRSFIGFLPAAFHDGFCLIPPPFEGRRDAASATLETTHLSAQSKPAVRYSVGNEHVIPII